MNLVLRCIALNDRAMSRPLIGRFDKRGGTLGRSDDATLTLPDPERLISRLQAQVLYRDGQYWIENVSNVSPILHNGHPVGTGMRVALHDTDELRIGGYTLQAAFENDPESDTILRGRTLVPGLPPAAAPEAPPASSQSAPERLVTPASASTAPADTQDTLAEPLRTPLSRAAAADGVLWGSFVEGIGVELATTDEPSPELLRSIGEMMRVSVDGIQRLISMQAENKIQAAMTKLQLRDNNPLKFAPDSVLALRMLLQPPAGNFLTGPAALRDALTDLQSHQTGMTAGMRAVLEAVLDRLNPKKLEALLGKHSFLDYLRPMRRRVRLWELYLNKYDELCEEAQDDFQRSLGETFRAAYEAHNPNAGPDKTTRRSL
jgi:predicted component of type VI protein secretion system